MRRFVFCCALSLLLPLLFFAEDARPYRETLGKVSQEVHTQLDDLKAQSAALTESLRAAETALESSQGQVKELRRELTALNTSLESTRRRLSDCSTRLTAYEGRLRTWRRAALAEGAALVLLLALAVARRLGFLAKFL